MAIEGCHTRNFIVRQMGFFFDIYSIKSIYSCCGRHRKYVRKAKRFTSKNKVFGDLIGDVCVYVCEYLNI